MGFNNHNLSHKTLKHRGPEIKKNTITIIKIVTDSDT